MLCGQSTLIIYFPITSKFHIWITFIKLGFSDNQDGHQNGRHLSVYTCEHSNLVIYHPISSFFFHIWTTFIKLLFVSEYGFCQMNYYQDFRQNRYLLFVDAHLRSPLSKSNYSSVKPYLSPHCPWFEHR